MTDKEVLEVIRTSYMKSSPAERRIMDYIMRHPTEIINCNVSDLAGKSGTSDATVVRLCHNLGYNGYSQFRLSLAMDLGSKKIEGRSPSPGGDIKGMIEEFCDSITAVGKSINQRTLELSTGLIKHAGCVHLLAVGNTANITQYMGFRLEKVGIKSSYYRDPLYTISQLSFADRDDILISISKSGESSSVIEGTQLAKDKGLPIIAITAVSSSSLSKLSDYVFLSNGVASSECFHKVYSYLNEIVIVDTLLNFLVND